MGPSAYRARGSKSLVRRAAGGYTIGMNTKGFTQLLLAALLALPSALKAEEFVSIPVILTIHGLNPAAISCDPGSVQNFLHNEACYAAASLFSKMGDGDFDDSYLDYHVNRLCGTDCGQVTAFRWGGDIKNSRASVDRLKEEILALDKAARKQGAPLIIIAHSWGTVLAAEALAEMDNDGTAGELKVHKLVTLGSPLGSTAYSLAINGLISGQRFYKTPRRASSIVKWENYYTDRDAISSRVTLADANTAIDSDPKYAAAQRRLNDLLSLINVPGYEQKVSDALEDLDNFGIARGTMLWHAAYFTRHSLSFKSLGDTLVIDAVDSVSPSYFQY